MFEFTVAIALIYTELKKGISSRFTEEEKVTWNEWELRLMVFCSLFLQFFLFKCGNRQGYSTKQRWLVIFVWSAYMAADWFATVSLKSLRDQKEDMDIELMATWTPFLVLHLGGADTITAYDLKDNELWIRHLFGMFFQLWIAFVVIVYWISWSSRELLPFVTIPIFVAGIIKNIERILALRSASKEQIRNSLLKASPKEDSKNGNKDPQRTYTQTSKEAMDSVTKLPYKVIYDDAIYLHEAYFLHKLFRNLFADLTIKFSREGHNVITITSKSAKQAFKLVKAELGFLYDELYTKTTIIHSLTGMFSRFLCLLCSFSSSVAFAVTIARHPYDYSKIDLAITVFLLVGAITLDIARLRKHINSDQMMIWLTKSRSKLAKTIYQTTSTKVRNGEPGSMAQYNLIDYCLDAKSFKFVKVLRCFDPYDAFLKRRYMTEIDVDNELKEFIFSHLKDKHIIYEVSKFNSDYIRDVLDARRNAIKELFCKITGLESVPEYLDDDDLGYPDDDRKFIFSFVRGMEFDKSLLIWHIATDLNYYREKVISSTEDTWESAVNSLKRNVSKSLSDYMFYLLSVRSYMLPKGIGEVRIRDTYQQLQQFFPQDYENYSVNRKAVCNSLLRKGDEFGPGYPEGPKLESALPDAIRLHKQLQLLGENKWDTICKVWVELLTYAARKCEWNRHVGHLKRGKELVTQVSLLMAHLFLSEQIHLRTTLDPGSQEDKKHYDWDRFYYLA